MLAILMAVALMGSPTDDEMLQVIQSEEAKTLADALSRCKGVWLASSGFLLATNQPANAKLMKERANGSQIAAAWILAMRHGAQNPNDKKPLAAWDDYVNGLAETSATAVTAAIERGDNEQLGALIQGCGEMLEVQQAFIDMMREQALTPP